MERTRHALGDLKARQLGDLRLAVMMLDGRAPAPLGRRPASATSSTGHPGRCACARPPPGCSKPRSSSARVIGYTELTPRRRRGRTPTPPAPAHPNTTQEAAIAVTE